MKKKILVISVALTASLGIFLWMTRDKLPRDPIARYMVQENSNKIVYMDNGETYEGGIVYHFILNDLNDKELLRAVLQAYKEAIYLYDRDRQWNYYSICLWEPYLNNNTSKVIYVSNYNDKDKLLYDDFQYVEISGFLSDSLEIIYNHAETYLQLKNVRTLVITPKIDKDAKENGIDWYKAWQELESYEVSKCNSSS